MHRPSAQELWVGSLGWILHRNGGSNDAFTVLAYGLEKYIPRQPHSQVLRLLPGRWDTSHTFQMVFLSIEILILVQNGLDFFSIPEDKA